MLNKKTRNVAALLMVGASLGLTGCGIIPGTSAEKIDPGYAGLLLKLYGGEKGIENAEVLTGGRVWFNGYSEEIVEVPLFRAVYPFTASSVEGSPNDESITFSVSGSPVNADIGVSYNFNIEPSNIEDKPETYTNFHAFYENYRKSPEEFTDSNLRQGLRSCFGTTAEDLELQPSDLASKSQMLLNGVQGCLQARFPEIDIQEVSQLAQWRLEPKIQESIDEQFAAQQAAQTAIANKQKVEAEADAEVAKAEGEAKAAIARAKGEAEANRLLAESVTPNLIELQRLEAVNIRAAKWNGQEAPIVQAPNVQLGASTPEVAPPQ